MGEARLSRGHVLKILGELGILNADRRFISRCCVNGLRGGQSCPFCHVIDGKVVCVEAPSAEIDVDDVPPLECPLRTAARVLTIDPEAL